MNVIKSFNVVFGHLFLALFLLGCSEQKLNPIGYDDVILAFGDSLTYGVGVEEENSYPSVLAELSNRTVINAGISGETTDEGLERLPNELATYAPHTLILIEGGNDILKNKDLKQTKRNLSSMISLAQNQGIQVVLVGVPAKKLFSSRAPLYNELAEEFNLVYEDSIIAELIKTPRYKSDPIHFNEAGYKKLAERLYQVIKDNNGL